MLAPLAVADRVFSDQNTRGTAPPLVILNARVIDGSGGPEQRAGVLVLGDRIARVGDVEAEPGDAVIDAGGLVLAPGFIDTHSHHESALQRIPDALGATSQGITTIVAGQDGGHPYPLTAFFDSLEVAPVAINVASMAGFGQLRGEVMGDDYQRRATPEEQAAMEHLLIAELEAGALGLSSGLEYDPGSFSSTAEVVALARLAATRGGVYITHIRSEDTYFWEAVDEAIRIGRDAGIPVRITHIKLALARWWGQTGRLLEILDEARAEGLDVTADIYPYQAWNTGFSWLQTQFPERDLERREGADFILNDMLSPETILLGSFPAEPALGGMTIAEVAALREADPSLVLMQLLKDDIAAGAEADMLGFAMSEDDIERIMAWPHTVVASDGELEGSHPRGFGSFARFLGHYVRDRQVMSLEEGVRRSSALPARQVGIEDRGVIREGAYADLVLFDPDVIIDRATYDAPHRPATGIRSVWVNGVQVFDGEAATGQRPGRIIRRVTP